VKSHSSKLAVKVGCHESVGRGVHVAGLQWLSGGVAGGTQVLEFDYVAQGL
jgi:hypothetical protein